jgi:aromatic ring hydroxylase
MKGLALRKTHGLTSRNCDFTMENGDFTINKWDFTIEFLVQPNTTGIKLLNQEQIVI